VTARTSFVTINLERKKMDQNETNNEAPKPMDTEQVLIEILENSKATKKYMKWQLYITLVLVVIPLLAAVIIVPMVFSSLSSLYSGSVIQ
jgi:hypothetical protein